MIDYFGVLYGLNLILRVHGSAVYKASIPGLLSAALYLLIVYRWDYQDENLDHPYAIGVLVTSVSFLIVFRANNAYGRYWEACGSVHQMMSKWLDAVVHTGTYHLQCSHYNHIKPPSYYDSPDLDRLGLSRDRELAEEVRTETKGEAATLRRRRRVERSINHVACDRKRGKAMEARRSFKTRTNDARSRLAGPPRLDGGWGGLFDDGRTTHYGEDDEGGGSGGGGGGSAVPPPGFESTRGGRTHALFLQELAHLASLAVAVAFCTLRNDVEGSESPLCVYRPGDPWPEADPDRLPRDVRELMGYSHGPIKLVKFWCGFTRTPGARARHNASRPMPVIGGVSDNEIAFLQRARGASAKTTLAWSWLSEFIIREQLAGSLGAVGPPIISRIFQFLSDGMISYNHARKIMYIPFPFPSAQLSAFFVLVMVPTIPVLMGQYTNVPWLGAVFTFLTVTCLVGLHEVARELENPFRNMPNDIPLVTLLAMFNESLITMYAGYHPDHYWDPEAFNKRRNTEEQKEDHEDKSEPMVPQSAATGAPQSPRDVEIMLETLEEKVEMHMREIKHLRGFLDSQPDQESNGVDE